MYDKLVFIRKCNPIYEDYCKKYSTLRFYSETIIALANRLGISQIDIPYFSDVSQYDAKNLDSKQQEAIDWFYSEKSFEQPELPVNRFRESAIKSGILTNIYSIENFKDYDYKNSLVIVSFMTDPVNDLDYKFKNYIIPIINESRGFVYLASDNEYSGYAYKQDNSVINCLEFIGDKILDLVIDKLKCIIMTESNYKGLRNKLSDKFNCPVFYLPMIIDSCHIRFRIDDEEQYSKRENKIAMLKNLNTFMEYKEFFDVIKGHGVVFESSMPARQRKYKPFCEEYQLTYKFARFWRMAEFENKISQFRIFLGMSNVGSSRFTSKILEGTNAGCITINPVINLDSLGFLKEEYPICNKVLEESEILDVKTIDNWTSEECSISLAECSKKFLNYSYEEYLYRMLRQKKFILDYFTLDSDCVQECLSKIIPYLKKVGE